MAVNVRFAESGEVTLQKEAVGPSEISVDIYTAIFQKTVLSVKMLPTSLISCLQTLAN